MQTARSSTIKRFRQKSFVRNLLYTDVAAHLILLLIVSLVLLEGISRAVICLVSLHAGKVKLKIFEL